MTFTSEAASTPSAPTEPHTSSSRIPVLAIQNRRRFLLCATIAFLLPFLLYLPTLRFGFVDLDDGLYIVNNPLATAPLTLSSVKNAFFSRGPANIHVPLVWLSYMMDVSLYGKHPWAFHLTNTLLHALNTLLLFSLLLRLGRRFRHSPPGMTPNSNVPLLEPLLLSLLWALHPLRVESVAWLTERKDCLSVLFCFLVVHAWLSALDAPSPGRRTLHGTCAFLFFAFGLLSKPSLVPLPILLAILALPPCRPRTRWIPLVLVLLPFLALSALSSRSTTLIHDFYNSIVPPPILSRIATIPSVLLFYLSKSILPIHLAVIYPQWTTPLWLGALLALPILATAVWLFHRRHFFPLLWLGTVFAALFFLPVSGMVPIPFNLVADRYSLLPAVGLSIAMLEFVSQSPGEKTLRSLRLFPLILFLLVGTCATATAIHLPTWRDSDALYLPVRRLHPNHHSVRAHDAFVARNHGDFASARECVARAARIFSDYELFLADVPCVNALDGPQAALSLLFDNPPLPSSKTRWAVLVASAQLSLGRPSDALATVSNTLPSALPADPLRNILLQIGMIASHELGDTPASLAFARQAGIVPPESTFLSRGHFLSYYFYLWDNDDRIPALHYFRDLAQSTPSPAILNNIAWTLATALWSPAPPSEAVGYARQALETEPPGSPLRPTLLDTLSVALANDGQFDAAASSVSEAMSLLPPSSPSLPAMRSRLALYRQGLPYREILGEPLPPDKYSYDLHL